MSDREVTWGHGRLILGSVRLRRVDVDFEEARPLARAKGSCVECDRKDVVGLG